MNTVGDVERMLNEIAPLHLAQEWDNVGLLAGNARDAVRSVLLCIDLTGDVLNEAVRGNADLVVAYHPPVFRATKSLRIEAEDDGPGISVAMRAVRAGIAIYSPHTALDAAEGGTGDAIAVLCGAQIVGPLDHATELSARGLTPEKFPALAREVKLTVFVPPAKADAVADAMFAAGAGRIGLYERCSFRTPGTGTFFGTEGTRPVVGKRGALETVDEIRVEMVCPRARLPEVVAAMKATHPYEEPAYDLLTMDARPVNAGIGRLARLIRPAPLGSLALRLSAATGADYATTVGDLRRVVRSLAILVGSAGRVQDAYPRARDADVLITGEIRHHDALAIAGHGGCAIALGHWASERPVLEPLRRAMLARMKGLRVRVSRVDCDPFAAVRVTRRSGRRDGRRS